MPPRAYPCLGGLTRNTSFSVTIVRQHHQSGCRITDAAAMERALDLARTVRGRTYPNPAVGAVVIASDGTCVGEGATQRAGGPHAEVMALRSAGNRTRNATLVVTLEPCNHHGSTPPCTSASLEAGITRVIVAVRDPNPKVRGGGVEFLRSHSVEVVTGVCGQAATELAQGYFKFIKTGRPHITAKWAMTLDGRIAGPGGGGRISGSAAWSRVHALRDEVDAIITGIGTIQSDDSRLTVRPMPIDGHQPVRVVFDSLARIDPKARVLQAGGETLLITTEAAPPERLGRLTQAGANILSFPQNSLGRVDIVEVLDALGQRGLTSALLEAGPGLVGAFMSAHAIDRVVVFVAPWILGSGISAVSAATELNRHLVSSPTISPVGSDVMIIGDVCRYGPNGTEKCSPE